MAFAVQPWSQHSDIVQVVAFASNTHTYCVFQRSFWPLFPIISCEISAMVSSITSFRASGIRGRTLYTSELTYPHRKSHMGSNGGARRPWNISLKNQVTRNEQNFVTDGQYGPWLHLLKPEGLCVVFFAILFHFGAKKVHQHLTIVSQSHSNSWSVDLPYSKKI